MDDLSKRLRDDLIMPQCMADHADKASAAAISSGLGQAVRVAEQALDALDARDAEIARLAKWNQDMVAKAASGGALDGYRELGARAARAEAEVERLRGYITRYLSGDYLRPVGKVFRDDGKPSKHDECTHGRAMWEDCESCIDEHFRPAVEGEQDREPQA